jgi:beta,beta-carotene 9',10'-dioxygenase
MLTRYALNLDTGDVSHEVLAQRYIETPTFDERKRFAEYRYCYGVSSDCDSFDNSIVKIDVQTGDVLEWSEEGVYAGEPLFVANEDASGEDQGTLLSIVVSPEKDGSFLIILSAEDLRELCRIPIPGYSVTSPLGFFVQEPVDRVVLLFDRLLSLSGTGEGSRGWGAG